MRITRDRVPGEFAFPGLGVVLWWRSRDGFWRGWRLWPL